MIMCQSLIADSPSRHARRMRFKLAIQDLLAPREWASVNRGTQVCSSGAFGICEGEILPEIENCDFLDNNCNGAIDEGFDTDNDTFSTCGGDCNDGDPTIHPTAPEVCDGLDNNCDGTIDEGNICGSSDADNDGFTVGQGDCNDNDASINPGALDFPDGSFLDSNCDGIDGDESRAIFVANNGTNTPLAEGGGTPASPMQTIEFALTQVGGGKDQLYISEGTYNEQVRIVDGISMWGKFSPTAGWTRSDLSTTRISGNRQTTFALLGLEGLNITSPTIIGDFELSTSGFVAEARTNYAVYCNNCGGVVFERNTIIAGLGGSGRDGFGGDSGLDGGNGADGANGNGDNATLPAPGGTGGFSTCGSLGGRGGNGGQGLSNGSNGQGGLGVGAGFGGPGGVFSECSLLGTCTPIGNGESGASGAAGTLGAHGGGGSGGTVTVGFWVAQSGLSGTAGTHGSGGGGGGGGGGQGGATVVDGTGNGGGGGGAGGCGGNPGTGGIAGGGSFGIFLHNSTGVVLAENNVSSGTGGPGGSGGVGGAGGAGGSGGNGAQQDIGEVGQGGNGESGGAGGQGGHGGGGAGGVSFSIGLSNTTVDSSNNVLTHGTGGAGGLSLGESGQIGASGTVGTF